MVSPRKRAARWRYVQYVILVAVFVGVFFAADWPQLQRAFFNWELVKEQFPGVLTIALKNTLIYTACGFTFGLALGLILALMRLSSVGPYRWIATIVIEIFRGLPALVVFIGFAAVRPMIFVGIIFVIRLVAAGVFIVDWIEITGLQPFGQHGITPAVWHRSRNAAELAGHV